VSGDSIAVVVPMFNHQQFVGSALNSIAEQTRVPDEIVIIDDCSTDGSVAAMEKALGSSSFKGLRDRVVFVAHSRNAGAHATINHAVSLVESEWVAVLNSDDMFHPRRLQQLLGGETESVQWMFSGVRWIDDNGRDLRCSSYGAWNNSVERAKRSMPALSWAFLEAQVTVSTGNLVFRKALWRELDGFCDLEYCHDWDFVLRASLLSEPRYVDEALYAYRDHDSNSFKSLQGVAVQETRQVAMRFVDYAMTVGDTGNKAAPSPVTWPEFFQSVAARTGFLQREEPGRERSRERIGRRPHHGR
jgi:glycosyltransferase involved in cell wall biosynthesis